jgi:hypothetical protein
VENCGIKLEDVTFKNVMLIVVDMGDQGVDVRIILKWIFGKWDVVWVCGLDGASSG